MDETLSKFVDETRCDPSFARDLLEGKQWNFDEALKAFRELNLEASETSPQQQRTKPIKTQRGISVVNSDIVQKARIKVLPRDGQVTDSPNEGFEDMARFTFVLPDLSSYPDDFADFLREDLIETSALVALEQSGNLNWWSDIGICQRLVPLATVGDGNCLLHAASLGMWGFHDRLLTLRKALFSTLISDSASDGIKRRWRLEQYQRNMEAGGLVYTNEEWEKEWQEVLRLASTSRKKLNKTRPKLTKNQSLPLIDEGGEKEQIADKANKTEPGQEQPETGAQNEPENAQPDDKNRPVKVKSVVKSEPGKVQPDVKNEPGKVQQAAKNEPGKVPPVFKNQPGKVQQAAKNEPGKELPVVKNEPGKVQPVAKNEPEKAQQSSENVERKAPKEHSPKPTSQSSSESKEKAESTEVKKNEAKREDEEENEGAFESLEEIHVFVLAHVLRRPIIIIADKFLRDFSGDPIAPIPFGGIYLPCECPPATCLKTPLILAFESAHFSAVVASEGKGKQENLVTAIPIVNHEYQLLPIHFSVDPGENFDWSTLDKETELPSKLLLSAEQKLELLGKYLDIVQIKLPVNAKAVHSQGKPDCHQASEKKKEVVKEGEKGINSWISNQINKVGNLAGKIKGSWESNTLCAAKLKTDQKPEYYTEMINNYIESAKMRFEERKKQQEAKQSEAERNQSRSYPCPTTGCHMYGRADTNYLCSGCYRTQKSASESGIYKKCNETQPESKPTFGSYLPPISTYLDYPNSISNFHNAGAPSTRNIPLNTSKVQPPSYAQAVQNSSQKADSNMCLTEGCSFYGSPEQRGFCSSCYKKKPH